MVAVHPDLQIVVPISVCVTRGLVVPGVTDEIGSTGVSLASAGVAVEKTKRKTRARLTFISFSLKFRPTYLDVCSVSLNQKVP